MDLHALIARYALEKDVESGTQKWLTYVVNRFSRSLGRIATTDDLADEPVNNFLAALLGENMSRVTVKGYRGGLVMLWRFACELDDNKPLPRRLRKVKCPKAVPCA